MEWYKSWFNSEEYLKVYRHRDNKDAEALIELFLNNIDTDRVKNLLDMACGAGRHAVILAQKGFTVTAVDLSDNLLSVAKSSAADSGVNIDFIQSDIRDFKTDKKFDLILNLFTSIGYFEQDEENYFILKKAYDLLAGGGFFVLDYFNKEYVEANLEPQTVDEFDNTRIVQNRFISGERVIKEITIDSNGKTNKFVESVRMFSYDELIGALKKIGFKIKNVFGDFKGSKFKLESSPRIIIIASK
ncbi:dTDP-3-amino-3,4, 6-trideoxy-alpha-D-glucopyranose [bacterium BMS3Abin03]|nr:dTDP-3-amino-3,4, 6-trideoxy-alpha-D-glucopyranose [bacterium BMS3Abin03]